MRTLLIILLTLFLVPALLITGILGTANWVLTESFISSSIREVVAQVNFEEIVVDNIHGESGDTEEFAKLILPHLNFGVILGDISESLVQGVFGFLTGKTDDIALTLDMSPLVGQMEELLLDKDFFLDQAKQLDPAEYELLKKLSDADLREIQEKAVTEAKAEAELNFDQVDIFAKLTEDNPGIMDMLIKVRTAFSRMRTALYIGAGACLVLIALLLVIRLSGGLVAAGIAMVINGGIFVLIPTAFKALSGTLLANIPKTPGVDAGELVYTLVSKVMAVPRNIGLIYCAVALVLFLAAFISDKIKTKRVQTT